MKKRMNKGLAFLLAMVMALGMLPGAALAVEDPTLISNPVEPNTATVWDGMSREQPTGVGTQEEPYQISTGAQLAWFAALVNGELDEGEGNAGAHAQLTEDIDLGDHAWTPIGTDTNPFTGVFDGNGKKVKNLTVSNGADGLFGCIGSEGQVHSLTVEQSIIVEIALAFYDKNTYEFYQNGNVISVTLDSTGNTSVIDVLNAAQAQELLTYGADESTYGAYVHTINSHTVNSPDGWMFTINDVASMVSASSALVKQGDRILWYEGTTENLYQGPTWEALTTEATPEWIDITSADELIALCSGDAGAMAQNYRLTTSLDLSDQVFSGIGTEESPFTGRFDGQGYTISNLKITGEGESTGMFSVIQGATIQNLNIENADVTGSTNVGVLAGKATDASLIGNCTVSGRVSGKENVGGLAGQNKNSSIDKCKADVTVTETGEDADGSSKIGGLVGAHEGLYAAYITNSSATGDVIAANSTMVGGLCGEASGTVYDSYGAGNVTGKSAVGGLIGSASGGIYNSYSLGSVTGSGDEIGGLIGSASGSLGNVISAGTVTGTGTNIGGLVGKLAVSGTSTLTGAVQNAYANCVGLSSPIGNASDFTGEDDAAAAIAGMALGTIEAVSNQLWTMFGVNLKAGTDLAGEAAKYADLVVVGDETAVSSVISLLKEGQSAGEGVTVSVEVAESGNLTGGSSLTLTKSNDTAKTLSQTVLLTLSQGEAVYKKNITIVLKANGAARSALMDAIAATYTNTTDSWTAMDMAAYATLDGKTAVLSSSAKQNLLNLLITEAVSNNASASDRARLEIVLRSMGVDSTQLYQVNSNDVINNASKLSGMSESQMTEYGYYAAPWILMAELQGQVKLTDAQRNALFKLLTDNLENGVYGYSYEGVYYLDADTTALAITALSQYEDKEEMVAEMVSGLQTHIGENGSFGNANSDAMVICSLISIGTDPSTMKHEVSGLSVVDGLFSYVNLDTNQFQFFGADNALATEQGFRALVALEKYDGNTAYNIYDWSGNAVQPGRATGAGVVETPAAPDDSDPTISNITVSFLLKTDSEIWIPKCNITVKEGSTVYHAFVKALAANQMTSVGAENGYVKSITKNGVTLSEFEKGANSGWQYKVNGVAPNVGLTGYTLQDGDDIVWYYTTDWTTDTGSVGTGTGGSGGGDTEATTLLKPESITDQNGNATATVDSKDITAAIGQAEKDQTEVIFIVPSGADQAGKITVALNEDSIRALAEAELTLQVETPVANMTIGAEGLQDLASSNGRKITLTAAQNADRSVTLTVAVDEEEQSLIEGGIKGTIPAETGNVVVLISENGQETIVKKSIVEQNVAYMILAGSATVKIISGGKDFVDVQDTDWFANAADFASSHELFQGTSSIRFSPNLPMTRGMMVTVLHRLEDMPNQQNQHMFEDVESGTWYTEAVQWATAIGIIEGDGGNRFAPEKDITREELVTILYRYANTIEIDMSPQNDLSKFPDGENTSSWAKEAMEWAVGTGLITGKDGNRLDPTGIATRAEVAIVLQRLVAIIVK